MGATIRAEAPTSNNRAGASVDARLAGRWGVEPATAKHRRMHLGRWVVDVLLEFRTEPAEREETFLAPIRACLAEHPAPALTTAFCASVEAVDAQENTYRWAYASDPTPENRDRLRRAAIAQIACSQDLVRAIDAEIVREREGAR